MILGRGGSDTALAFHTAGAAGGLRLDRRHPVRMPHNTVPQRRQSDTTLSHPPDKAGWDYTVLLGSAHTKRLRFILQAVSSP